MKISPAGNSGLQPGKELSTSHAGRTKICAGPMNSPIEQLLGWKLSGGLSVLPDLLEFARFADSGEAALQFTSKQDASRYVNAV